MRRFAAMRMLLGGFVAVLLLAGCGGEGETPQSMGLTPSGPVSVLTWDPPARFTDNDPVDPYRDIDHYEVYVREDANFTNSDNPVMLIPAVTTVDPTRAPSTVGMNKGKKPNAEFILENLNPYISMANRQYVSLKAVGVDGQKSAFMAPVPWDRT